MKLNQPYLHLYRSSSVFTFNTRFPRQKPKPKFVKSASAGKKKNLNPRFSLPKLPSTKLPTNISDHQKKFALENNAIPDQSALESPSSFSNLSLLPSLLEALDKEFGFKKPSPIQSLLIPHALNENKHLLCASETGSGKTLAYLLPIFQCLKNQEQELMKQNHENTLDMQSVPGSIDYALQGMTQEGEMISAMSGLCTVRELGRPRAIVIVPSRELVTQITRVSKRLARFAKLSVLGLHSHMTPRIVKSKLEAQPIDLLITTPGALLNWTKAHYLGWKHVKWIVLDEADTLFDRDFSRELNSILPGLQASAKKHENELKLFFVSATLPKSLLKSISIDFPNHKILATPKLHQALSKVKHHFLQLDSSTTKMNLLLEILKQGVLKESRILVFCNTLHSCDLVYEFLKDKQYLVNKISSSAEFEERQEAWSQFNSLPSEESDCRILVATDMASRGIDTIQCGHVILYDFPKTTMDYLHRTGRVGRMGKSGSVTSFIAKKDVRLADAIQTAIRKRQHLGEY